MTPKMVPHCTTTLDYKQGNTTTKISASRTDTTSSATSHRPDNTPPTLDPKLVSRIQLLPTMRHVRRIVPLGSFGVVSKCLGVVWNRVKDVGLIRF